jgi:hypothetical protein
MALRMVGAGVGRTGTHSLKLALEHLFGGRCYHMNELIERPADTAVWLAAVRGEAVDWDSLLADFAATVDWPACAFWRELSTANPRAPILLSVRESAETWWRSMERTIISGWRQPVPADDTEWVKRRAMMQELMNSFTPAWSDREATIAAYGAHNEAVRRTAPAGQLVEWRPGDGWDPLCDVLGVPVPEEPFPHVNRTADFRRSQGLED